MPRLYNTMVDTIMWLTNFSAERQIKGGKETKRLNCFSSTLFVALINVHSHEYSCSLLLASNADTLLTVPAEYSCSLSQPNLELAIAIVVVTEYPIEVALGSDDQIAAVYNSVVQRLTCALFYLYVEIFPAKKHEKTAILDHDDVLLNKYN